MINFNEYIEGKERYRSMIRNAPLYKKLDAGAYYPVVGMRDDDDTIVPGEIQQLPVKKCKVYLALGKEPVEIELYMDDWVGYELEVTDGVINE